MHPTLVKIAQARGFFREEGLDVTLQLHSSGKAALRSLIDGKADLATAADTPIMFALMQGAQLSLITTIETSTKNAAIIARRDRGIGCAADLKGRRVGVTLGTNGDYFLDCYLTLQGMSRRSVELVDMAPEQMTDALIKGRVDAVSIWNPLASTLRSTLAERGIMLHDDNIYLETFNIVSLQGLTRQSPETIRRLLRGLLKAEQFVANNPEESRRIMSEFCGMDLNLVTCVWEDFRYRLSLNQSLLVTLEDQGRWAMRNGLTPRRELPDIFQTLYLDGLKSVKPDAVRLIR